MEGRLRRIFPATAVGQASPVPAGQPPDSHQLFGYVLFYRWLALLPPLVGLAHWGGNPLASNAWLLLGLAAGVNAAITVFHPSLNTLLLRHPSWIAVDVVFCGLFAGLSGGLVSPYYLYALSPVFASGLFFQTRGGLAAAAAMSAVYGSAAVIRVVMLGTSLDLPVLIIQGAGFFLIGGLFSRFASLLGEQRATTRLLEQARSELVRKTAELQRTNRQLRSLHALAEGLQAAAVDVRDVGRKVLTVLTDQLGYPRALLGLVDHGDFSLTGWMSVANGGVSTDDIPPALRLPLSQDASPLARALATREVQEVTGAPHPGLSAYQLRRALILPLTVRELPVGVLVVEMPDGEASRRESLALLSSVAHQAALALWSTRMCVERAQRMAVQEERSRIAREIHDTVSQCLFGTLYTLDSCLRVIPDEHRMVRERLETVLRINRKALQDIRHLVHDLWVGSLTTAEFVAELQSYVQDLGAPQQLTVDIAVEGDLTELTPFTRKHLFRIAQEALANVVRHAKARHVTVRLAADAQAVHMTIQDDGVGFDPAHAGMGIHGMRERAFAVGGQLTVWGAPGQGTTVEVRVPRLACVSNPPSAS